MTSHSVTRKSWLKSEMAALHLVFTVWLSFPTGGPAHKDSAQEVRLHWAQPQESLPGESVSFDLSDNQELVSRNWSEGLSDQDNQKEGIFGEQGKGQGESIQEGSKEGQSGVALVVECEGTNAHRNLLFVLLNYA